MYINKIQITLFLLVFTLTPFIFCFYTTDAFEFPKVYFISITLLFISLITLLKKVNIRLNVLDLFFLLFLVLNIVAAFFSKDFMYAFFGYFGNPSGSIFFIFSIFVFLMLHRDFIVRINNITLIKLVLYSGFLPCLYGILQLLRLDPFKWSVHEAYERIFSTFGQPNFFAMFLGLLLISSLIYYFETHQTLIWVYASIIFLLLINTKSISVFISILICAVLTYILYFDKIKHKKLLVLVVLILGVLPFYVIFGRIQSQFFQPTDNIGIKTNDTAKIRLILWENTIKQSCNFKTLVLGNGADNFAFTFLRPEELNTTSEWSNVFFKPHNLFIESLFTTGILGLIFYLFIAFYSLLYLRKNKLFLLVLFLLLCSFFLWLPAYLYFLLIAIFYYLFSTYTRNIIFKSKVFYRVFIVPVLYVFVLSGFFVVSNIYYPKKPCTSYSLFPNFQPYALSCGIFTNNDNLVVKGLALNSLNKIYIEKSGLYFLNKYDRRGFFIFEQAYFRDPKDPVYMYYYGLSNEIFGNKEKAIELYKKAKENSTNFYLNDAAIQRLNGR